MIDDPPQMADVQKAFLADDKPIKLIVSKPGRPPGDSFCYVLFKVEPGHIMLRLGRYAWHVKNTDKSPRGYCEKANKGGWRSWQWKQWAISIKVG